MPHVWLFCKHPSLQYKFLEIIMPRVSVITNVRDGAAYLREALDSVIAQTFTDWELIVWDDCSKDDSARIVSEYSDDRIHYFLSPEDTPLGRARQLAVQQARGQWLAFLDQDDIWLPRKVEQQIALSDRELGGRVGIVYGRTVAFDPHGRERDWDHWHEYRLLPEGDIFLELFKKSGFIAVSSAMLLRSAYEEIGGIPEEFQVIPDYHLFLAIARRYKARAVQEVVCRYRLHPASMSGSSRCRIAEEALWLFERWAHCLDPRLVALRQRTYQTLLALEETRRLRSARRGIGRLLSRGSIGYLVSRPFVRAFRAVRRRVCRPYWKVVAEGLS